MRVALIPPLAYLNDTRRTDIQLVLPHMMTNGRYFDWYAELSCDPKQTIILDNGAAEGANFSDPASLDKFWELLVKFQPSEFALPDTLYDRTGTVMLGTRFLKRYGESLASKLSHVKVGYVAQGTTHLNALAGVSEMMATWGSLIRVIYIPRLLVRPLAQKARIRLAEDIHYKWPHLEIHFFGMNQMWPGEIYYANTVAEFIRSVDTSMPYQFAYAGEFMTMNRGRFDAKIKRPDNYFDIHPDLIITRRNVNRLLRWGGLPQV